ncbi:MAG: dockerin type I domain-containing protein [Bacteroidia bacterium]|nr:dockerin type I domain-containing protein [Bacteroidia bacterium]
MKKKDLLFLASLLLLQAVCTGFGKLSAATLTADTLSWSWEVSTTTSTMTKSCTLEFTGNLTLNWGDGSVQTLTDSLSGTSLTHVYASVANFNCKATGTGILYFKADSKRLLTLDPTKSTAMTYLSFTSNQLATLDVSKNTELISLYCSGNLLTALNVSTCTKLQTLSCSDNKLSLLDVSNIPSLKKLTCHSNLLTSLRVCPTGSLSYISTMNCNLQVAELDTLFAQLPALVVSPSKNLYVLNNPGSANCNIQLANLKNWWPDKVVTSSSFYMPAASCNTGETVELDICLTNQVPAIAFELDVAFPSGFVLDTVQSCLAAARKGNHLLSIARTATDQYKFLVYSMTTGDKLLNSSGVVLQLFGKAPDTAKVCVVQLKQAVLVDTTTSMCTVTVTNGSLTVMPASVNGDVNGDKVVNVTDIVNLVAYINGRNPSGFNVTAADLDNNGFLNVADITRMVVIINASGATLRSSSIEPASGFRALVLYDKQSAASGNNLYLRQSFAEKNCLELCLDNTTPVQACQVDISLPTGVTLQTSLVSGKTFRQNGHLIQVSPIGLNKYRLLAYALRPDAAFKGDTGVLALLPIQETAPMLAANYPVYLDAPVLTGMNLTTIPSYSYDLSDSLGSLNLADTVLKAGTDG